MPKIEDIFIEIANVFFSKNIISIDDQDCTTLLVQTKDNKQIAFMRFKRDVISYDFHTNNCSQWGFVLDGEMSLKISKDEQRVLKRGDIFSIPKGTPHCVNIKQGYQDITVFDGKRYSP